MEHPPKKTEGIDQPKFLSPETEAIHAQIAEALAKHDYAIVAQLAGKAGGMEAKAKYDLELRENQRKNIESAKTAVVDTFNSVASTHDLLIKDNDRNPFLNPEYKSKFDALARELQDLISSDSPRKKYDFEQAIGRLIANLNEKVSRMRNSHLKANENENASMTVGSRVQNMVYDLENVKQKLNLVPPEEIPWDSILNSLKKLA